MMYLRKKIRWIAALLVIAMLIAPVAALGEAKASASLTKTNIWGVLGSGTTIYRDLNMSKAWTTAPRDVIVNVVGYGGNVAVIKNGSRLGCVPLSSLHTLDAGMQLCAGKRTRVYQRASLNSRYANVPKGMEVELVAVTGNCAKVKRGEYFGYMYIGHLLPVD